MIAPAKKEGDVDGVRAALLRVGATIVERPMPGIEEAEEGRYAYYSLPDNVIRLSTRAMGERRTYLHELAHSQQPLDVAPTYNKVGGGIDAAAWLGDRTEQEADAAAAIVHASEHDIGDEILEIVEAINPLCLQDWSQWINWLLAGDIAISKPWRLSRALRLRVNKICRKMAA